jgi:thioesterase domain-containing protein/acyl carrier protein
MLGNHPSIQEAVVELEKDRSDDGHLVGYVVLNKGRVLPVGELRSYLTDRLPHYMVPSTIIFLKTLPRTPNGKIDRQALIAMKQTITVYGDDLFKPEDYTERKLLDLWEGILGIRPIGINDNFFDLGGQSLLAIQLAAKIGKVFKKNVPPAIFYQATTIKKLAKLLQAVNEPPPSLLPIQPRGSQAPFFWIHGDVSNAFLPNYLGSDQPLYGLEHQSEDGKAARFIRVETIAEYYLRQIRTVQDHGPYFLGGYSFGGTIAFEIAQQLKMQGQIVSLLVILDSLFPGVSSSSPTIRGEPSESLTTPSQYSRYAFLLHRQRLAQLRLRGQMNYILVRLRNKIENTANDIGNRFGKIYKLSLCRVCLAFGWILPASVRSFYILEIYKHALQNYSPAIYPGRAIYFKTASRSNYHQQGWKSLMKDGLEVYEVPGDHMEIIKKENAEVWAKQLKSCLSAAQIKNLGFLC